MTGYNISQIQEKPTINVNNARCIQCERVRETGGCAAQSLSKLLSSMGDFRKSLLGITRGVFAGNPRHAPSFKRLFHQAMGRTLLEIFGGHLIQSTNRLTERTI